LGGGCFFPKLCAQKVTKLCIEKKQKFKKKQKVGKFFAFFVSFFGRKGITQNFPFVENMSIFDKIILFQKTFFKQKNISEFFAKNNYISRYNCE
jgi:hypothetical protein